MRNHRSFFPILIAIIMIILTLSMARCRNSLEKAPVPKAAHLVQPTSTLLPLPTDTPEPLLSFDGDHAFGYLADQVELGPRWPGTPGHTAVGDYIVGQLKSAGWVVEEQRFDYQGFNARNIIARGNQGVGDIIILGAHYDTRRVADQTPGAVEAGQPVPGAVDGASGVAVLLELARSLDLAEIPREIWLVFFDVEDNGRGGIPGWEYIAGSQYMAEKLEIVPEAVVVMDMVGDADQQLHYEGNSDPELSEKLWGIGAELNYNDAFIPTYRYTMIDDHLPFALQGYKVVLIIDFDYPYWHTVEDTIDKASPDSLMRVGHTLEVWLETRLD